jgi:transcriptional regulator with XRE-family HTH domain
MEAVQPTYRPALLAEMARRDITRAEIAKVIGVSPAGMTRRLNGRTPMTVTELQGIARHLGVPTSVLLGEEVTARISGAA